MKIKNLKLMLVGLLAMGSMNAFAAAVLDEDGRSVNGVNYQLYTDGDTKYAVVQSVNNQASEAEQKTITIPAEVTGEKGTYKVQEFATSWITSAKDVTAVTTSLSIDITNFKAPLANINALTKLESLTIKDNSADGTTTSLNLSAASFKGTLKSLNIADSKITGIADNGLKDFAALETIDLGKIKTIGANALDGCIKIKSLTVPATVTSVGASAFDNMTALETLVWNSDVTIPAAFNGDAKLKSVTVAAPKITTIASGAFTSTVIETIDLSGSPLLATVTSAFVTSTKLKSVNMGGTKIVAAGDIDISGSKATLEEWICADAVTSIPALNGFTVLKAVDLSKANMALDAVVFTGNKAMKTVKMNPEKYVNIAASAFEGCAALTTVEGVFHAKTATIGNRAFFGSGLASVDLSVTPLVTTINNATFGNMKNLKTVKLTDKITTINSAAFTHDVSLSSINLEATKITVLKNIFSSAADDETAPCDALKSLKLPETLTTVEDYALQMTGIEEIEIPASVTNWGNYVLQGCLNLKKFVWNDPKPAISLIGTNTFLGDDKLEEVRFITKNVLLFAGISDADFEGNDPARLNVYVNAESYAVLYAAGWTPANTKYATLVGEAETEFAFNAKGKSADGYYYATYYNANCDTWFPADKFEVFSAVLNGSKIELKAATVDNGYYKVARWNSTYLAGRNKDGIAVVRSKDEKANVEYKYLTGVYESTMPSDNALQVSDGTVVPSRLKFQYKLGVKDGQVKFWRITSGTLKKDAVFIESTNPKAPAFLDIVLEGEATGIESVKAIETVEANDGAIYNLQGARVSGAKKGLYIQNGKKFIVK